MRKDLVEKQNDLLTRADEVLNKAKEEKRELTEDEAMELAEIRDDVKKIKETLGLEKEFKDMDKKEVVEEKTTDEDRACAKEKQETRAFENYIRGKVDYNERANNLTEGDNGAVIPQTIANKIIAKVYDICPVLEKSNKYNVKGTLTIPYYDEEDNAIQVAYQTEFQDVESSVGEFTSTITLSGYLAGALIKISRSLINNSQFDIVGYVVDQMALHISRFIEHELLIGTEGKATGLSTLTNTVNTASASAITADELIELQDKVKDVYQNNAVWIMSTKTRTALRQLKDSMGRYMLQDDISLPFGHSLLGKPVYVSDNMPEIGSGNTAIYYGDLSGLATKFSENINIQILKERFATQHADACIAWLEFDSKVEDAQKLAKLVCGTTSV